MLTREENELLTRVGPGSPCGDLMRRYWIPAVMSLELPEPDGAPVRVRLLGEELRRHKSALGSLVSLEMGKIKAEGEVSSALARLLVVSEAYPDLKANQTMMQEFRRTWRFSR